MSELIKFQDIKVPDDWNMVDISSEEYRSYHYLNDTKYTIQKPIALKIGKDHGHRVIDAYGISHYIKPEWKTISWKADPHFVI